MNVFFFIGATSLVLIFLLLPFDIFILLAEENNRDKRTRNKAILICWPLAILSGLMCWRISLAYPWVINHNWPDIDDIVSQTLIREPLVQLVSLVLCGAALINIALLIFIWQSDGSSGGWGGTPDEDGYYYTPRGLS